MATRLVMMLLGLTLVLMLACGGAPAAPEPTATTVVSTAPAPQPTPVPVESDTSQPTPTPQAAAPPADVQVNPGKLTIMVGDLGDERFDAAFASPPTGGHNYIRVMGGFLISDNEEREMLPGIASSWELSDDGLTWDFTIREGVKFHDGSDLTAGDVHWTLQHYFGPQAVDYVVGSGALRKSRVTESIELSAPDKVRLITTAPEDFAYAASELSDVWYPILPERAELHDEAEELAYDNNPIGAGPMSLVEHVPASVMSFERFDDYYYQPANGLPEDKRMNLQELDMFLVPEEATRVAALRSGEADIAPVSLTARNQVEAGGGRLVFGREGVYFRVRLIGCWDPQINPPCGDKRVRQALDYAIDKELIRDTLYSPEVMEVKGWSFITPSTIGYTPELDPRPFDPAKARQLLADAGYPGGEGFGKLIVNTYPTTSLPLQVESAQLGAEFWRRELGLDVEVRVGDSVGVKEKEVAGELNGQILWRDNETRKDATVGIASNFGDPERSNRLHEDPDLYRHVQETVQIVDPDERAEALEELALRLKEETYKISVGYLNIPWGVGPRIQTWEPYPLAVYPSALHTISLK